MGSTKKKPDNDDMKVSPDVMRTTLPLPDLGGRPTVPPQAGLGTALLGALPSLSSDGMAGAFGLGALASPGQSGLAAALMPHGQLLMPDDQSKLTDITMGNQPTYLTPGLTAIKMNKPAPDTMLPWGSGLDSLVKFADGTHLGTVEVSGGSEGTGHSAKSAHGMDRAADISAHNPLSDEDVRKAAIAAGYTHGMFEIRPGKKPGDPPEKHWHLQIGPENIKNAGLYDLKKYPIRTVDYTQGYGKPGN